MTFRASDIASLRHRVTQAQAWLSRDPQAAERFLGTIDIEDRDAIIALRTRAQAKRALSRIADAEQDEADAIAISARRVPMADAIHALSNNRVRAAEIIVRQCLVADPDDIAALAVLADIAARAGLYRESSDLLRKVVRLAPGFTEGRVRLAEMLFQQNGFSEAVDILDAILASDPRHRAAFTAKVTMHGQAGDYDAALSTYRSFISLVPDDPIIWAGYGNILKTVGTSKACVEAFRHSLALDPTNGESWWGLANLKTVTFSPSDIAAMKAALDSPQLSATARIQIEFSLGKANEDIGEARTAFDHYRRGNGLRRQQEPYDADALSAEVDRIIGLFDAAFIERHRGTGADARDPIFIVGMPRAGSTLIEQILASHSLVEGTAELPDIPLLVHRTVADCRDQRNARFPNVLATLEDRDLKTLGEAYLTAAGLHRKTSKPAFIDKLPNNWLYVGFIGLILPNARIVDARRAALPCCVSNYRQYFARGQHFSDDLIDLGQYYRDYVRLMQHFEQVMPGAIYRVDHEQLVDNPDTQIRALLSRLELPFEDRCLRFHENNRAVRTASAEQVRRPINREGLNRWRMFDPWLDPLKTSLGDLIDI